MSNREESEISAIVATMREMVAMPSLNSSEKLLGRILVRTVMSTSTPDCYSEDELEVLKDFAEKIEMEPEDIIRMAVSIMAEGLAKKLNDAGGDDIFTVCP